MAIRTEHLLLPHPILHLLRRVQYHIDGGGDVRVPRVVHGPVAPGAHRHHRPVHRDRGRIRVVQVPTQIRVDQQERAGAEPAVVVVDTAVGMRRVLQR